MQTVRKICGQVPGACSQSESLCALLRFGVLFIGLLFWCYSSGNQALAQSNPDASDTEGGLIIEDNLDMKRSPDNLATLTPVVFPNPFQDRINLKHLPPGDCAYEIYRPTGKMILRGVVNHQHPIDLNELPPGLYLLHLFDSANQPTLFTIVKQ